MTTPVYGVTPQGFNPMRLPEVKDELEDLFISEFGDINLDPQSVAGQLIGIYSKVLADDWENLWDVYKSQYPNSATGVSLDNVVQLNGLTRLPALRTSVIGSATGTPGTLIPAGSLARLTGSGEIFFSTANAFINNGIALANTINVTAATAQQYTVLISGVSYIYSLPIISFTGPIVSGNVISVRINGVNMPTVPFVTNSATTLANLASVILANAPLTVFSASVVGNTVKLVPVLGKQIIVNSVNVSGGGAPTGSVIFDTPAVNDVAKYLAANISSSNNVTGTWVSGSSFTIAADDSSFPYALSVGSNLQITSTSSPINFLAQTYGPIAAPANTLTEIVTPVAGWTSLTNPQAGITGRNQETDAELRLRREQSLHLLGAATVEAIRSRLLQEVPGVVSVTVFENVTMTQDPISIVFSTDFITGNVVQVDLDSNNIGSVSYVSSHLQVMNDLAALIESQPEIDSVVVGGVGNRELTISMVDSQEIEIAFNISGGASQPTYTTSGGRPPKSFEAVVEGGSDAAVALKIWQLKPAGIQTFGNTHVVITDSQGNPQGINFTRATDVFIWVLVSLTLNPQETFPVNGQELVSEAILTYGNTLGIGIDVIIQRVQAVCFSVPGIASATVQLARTLSESDTPSYVSTDIDIGETEISNWDLSRINVSI
jgi:uncharacterized phage protein gp47/JayE